MRITAQEVNKLRKMTGAGMMDCKKALTEANGSFDDAIKFLRKKGQKVLDSRAQRKTSEGVVFAKINETATKGALVAFTCETDFVAKNNDFIQLGNQIAEVAFAEKPTSIDALNALSMENLTVGEKIIELTGKVGEKLEVKSFELLSGEVVIPYVHFNAKLGVLVALKNTHGKEAVTAGKDVAMQIAALSPIAVNKSGIDKTIVEKEIEIGKAQARQEGKPEKMVEKITIGKLNKFIKENTLLSQTFIKDSSKTISQYLDGISKGLTVSAFKRILID